jgi:polyisoprenoid-binding protein YceI
MTLLWRTLVLPWCMLLLAANQAVAEEVLIDRSDIRFVAKQLGVNVEGRFRKWTANVVFLPGALDKSRAEFDIDLASVDLASAESESELKGPAWFDSARFPRAHFASTAIKDQGGGKYEIVGALSLKGVARPCVVPVTLRTDAAGNRVAEGKFSLKRLDYRIGEGLWADTDTVANDVIVSARIVLPPGK